ncbi:hypothetical protein AAG570_004660 [Ranatra chinensis]|uniref:Uncharacterized protein n=1 Tax=Ranatra chinensis TaxID=642074 RepID=A0ABD0YJN7_9HEMI
MNLKLTWTYSIELWGSAKKGNIDRIHSFQSKVLLTILNAPWYVSNRTIHHDLNIPTVHETIQSRFKSFHSKLEYHPNPLANALSSIAHPLKPPRIFKRRCPRGLLATYRATSATEDHYKEWCGFFHDVFHGLMHRCSHPSVLRQHR